MKNIQLSSENQYKIQPTTDYYKPVTKDDNVLEENSELKQINEKLNLIDNETRTKIEENENIDFDNYSNESDKEAFKEQGIIYINDILRYISVVMQLYNEGMYFTAPLPPLST